MAQPMRSIRFGIIGCGLMGREFASAVARWSHLPEMDVRPELVAICRANDKKFGWYLDNFPSIGQATTDYRELLSNDSVDAIYCAVPHNLHEEIYCAVIEAGKPLMAEKPFGINLQANEAIVKCCRENPDVFVRCSSEFPFFPAVQQIGEMIEADAFGQIIEVESGFLHSSDLDPQKVINWKRMVELNGEYGCMGDLGMHACHVPFRAGWVPRDVRAVLSNIITQRPNGEGGMVDCQTWDNSILLCMASGSDGQCFPLTIKTQRIAPGEKNTWYLSIKGTKACASFTTKNPKRLNVLEYGGGKQVWQHLDMGHETTFASITGGIFEFGFSDAILQMWAAFLYELEHGSLPTNFAGCVTPEETTLSHRLFTAAVESHHNSQVVSVS